MAPQSLARRIFLYILLLVVGLFVTITYFEYRTARRQVAALYDQQLKASAAMLRSLITEELADNSRNPGSSVPSLLSDEDRAALRDFSGSLFYRIWYNGKLSNTSGGKMQLSADRLHDGFDIFEGDGAQWRVYTVRFPADRVVIAVGEPVTGRNDIILKIVADLSLPAILFLPGLLIVAWLAGKESLRSVKLLIVQLRQRSSNDLSRLDQSGWPVELWPIIGAMNGLFKRLAGTIETEKRITDLAAHQLRTPLASLRLQIQMARRTNDPQERDQILQRMQDTVIQTGNFADHLLALARIERAPDQEERAELRHELEAALIDILPLANERNQAIDVDAVGAAIVRLDNSSARLICSSLIENAVKYSPPDTAIRVRLECVAGQVILAVSDEGPGIPEINRDKMLERFIRGTTASQTQGSGLGLAIVAAAAARAGGNVRLDPGEDGRGLTVTVTMPSVEQIQPGPKSR